MSRRRNRIIEEDVTRIAGHGLPWQTLSEKTVLVSGANGFLPAYIVETLTFMNEVGITHDCKVIGLVRNIGKAEARFSHLLGRSDFSLLVHDVCTPVALEERVDVVIHAASQASPKYYGKDPVGTLSANTLGTHNLLSLAKRCGAGKFLFFSSCDVYGRLANPYIPAREDSYGYLDPTELRSCYPESKRLGETMCIAWNHQYGVPVRIVRPAHTYGPGMALDDGRVFADFVANVVRREDIAVKSNGVARRPFCYLADATLAYFMVLLNGKDREAYNVGNEECELSVGELATILANLFPERNLSVKMLPDFTQAGGYIESSADRGTLDTSKLRALGWRPTANIHEGFRRTILSYEPSAQ